MLHLARGLFEPSPPSVHEPISEGDVRLASIAMGWTLGFGLFTALKAFKQSCVLSTYVVLVWIEIAVCLIFAIICWLYLIKVIPHSFSFYFCILTCWAIQTQVLVQIICNRIVILVANPLRRWQLKVGVAGFIAFINLAVYSIWIPARLGWPAFVSINKVWDRVEKVLYLLVDGALNYIFIKAVSTRLVDLGLTKYDRLLLFNKRIVGVSLSLNVLLIGLMSLPNDFVYMQFHPVIYIAKLHIECSMRDIMIKVASASTGIEDIERSEAPVEAKHECGTGPVHVRIVHTVEEEVDPNYPITLREGRGANRYEEKEDEKDRSLVNEEAYPAALAKYQTIFAQPREQTQPSLTDSPTMRRGTANPFVSTDTLKMHKRPTSLNSTRVDISPDSDVD